MVAQHEWVKHTVTSVSVVPDPENDDQIVVLEDTREQSRAEEQAVYGCDRCGVPMSGNTDTLCDGPSGED